MNKYILNKLINIYYIFINLYLYNKNINIKII